eukprot:545406-Amphidinium_carterae.1
MSVAIVDVFVGMLDWCEMFPPLLRDALKRFPASNSSYSVVGSWVLNPTWPRSSTHQLRLGLYAPPRP